MNEPNFDEDGPPKKVKRVGFKRESSKTTTYDYSNFCKPNPELHATEQLSSSSQTFSSFESYMAHQQSDHEPVNKLWFPPVNCVPTHITSSTTLHLSVPRNNTNSEGNHQNVFSMEELQKSGSERKYVTVKSTWIPPFEEVPVGNSETPFNKVMKMDIFVTNTPRDKNWILPPLCEDLKLFIHGFIKYGPDAKRSPKMAVKIINERIFEFVGKRIEPCIISTLLYGTREIPSEFDFLSAPDFE